MVGGGEGKKVTQRLTKKSYSKPLAYYFKVISYSYGSFFLSGELYLSIIRLNVIFLQPHTK